MAKSCTCLAQAFLILYLVFFLFSFFQFFLSISPLFVLTLTADAHCSGKLGSGRKQNKYSTKPKGFLCTPSAQHIHMCYTFFLLLFPRAGGHSCPHGWKPSSRTSLLIIALFWLNYSKCLAVLFSGQPVHCSRWWCRPKSIVWTETV